MKKISVLTLLMAVAMIANAVPAKPGWQKRTQADGSTIDVQLVGDEFYHYYINKEGQEIRLNKAGMFEVVADQPTPAERQARRAKAVAHRQPKSFGSQPNLAPRGVVILANFKDQAMLPAHTKAVFDELCNATHCTVNEYNGVKYGSAAEYFADQSNGTYRPVFDVYGPVTLSKDYSYYGHNIVVNGEETDEYAADAVVEACLLADQQYNIDFKQYDSDNDGYVDFVYLIYAGLGEASGGDENTIWPHNWSIQAVISSSLYPSVYSSIQTKIDGVYLDNYACSNEIESGELCGIGTLCHEFGHVMGLPDLYDTSYGKNDRNNLTPNQWDIMDVGSYNGDAHCPPNYDPWEKYFFGWVDPFNPGDQPMRIELHPNGTPNYAVLQINEAGEKKAACQSGRCFYLENRQYKGWDTFLPAHGMLIWVVKYDAASWTGNTTNNTPDNPKFTLVCSEGTERGNTNAEGNVFGGDNPTATSWEFYDEKPVTNIRESNGIIYASYIADTTAFTVTWLADGDTIETKKFGFELLQLPAAQTNVNSKPSKANQQLTNDIVPCEGAELLGWTEEADWHDPLADPEDLFTTNESKIVRKNTTYRALFK